ncbi:MAG: hypothetical protein L0H64_23845 [Pseudonocardia sp.]|nr:hypothetical protein [Pseudonocardia sp.]
MAAVPEGELPVPEEPRVAGAAGRLLSARDRRVVAVTVSAMELLRPESDLARLLEGVGHVDLLVASEDAPFTGPTPLGMLAGCELDGSPVDDETCPGAGYDEVHADVTRLGIPELYLHRLGLSAPLGPQSDVDLLAALSELVGFDPEPGVYLLGPSVAAARVGSPAATARCSGSHRSTASR